eukprot:TRINITY_DN100485_c0_g1_i1.p1 TRINITY_DN100485_c0_g1~~TRINITY_DN100485_c0_g1_i1.p1  ORF type:complete len:585 (-),score=170.12 TRINITY_DN100485_c0_g1_i1:579-2231(-)
MGACLAGICGDASGPKKLEAPKLTAPLLAEQLGSNKDDGRMSRQVSCGSAASLSRRRCSSKGSLDIQIPMDDLQGKWYIPETGSQIMVMGRSITIDGGQLQGHALTCDERGSVQGIEQICELDRRLSLGGSWAAPVDGQVDQAKPCRWVLYGMRDGSLVWREGKREVVWKRPPPPLTLETLQGDWVNSMGAKINIEGNDVVMNGCKMFHKVVVNDDGTVRGIGTIWQLKGWLEEGKLEFKEAPSMEVAEYARSVVWTVASEERMKAWNEQMKGLGYAGSAADPLKRGIEGCVPGTCDAAAKLGAPGRERDLAEAKMLNDLIQQFMEPHLKVVPPVKVIPDFTNRGQTGLSLEHVHYLATNMTDNGFIPRTKDKGHDIPVLVRECPDGETAQKAVSQWKQRITEDKGFAPWFLNEREEFFTSLGNGHFYQALNAIRTNVESIYKKDGEAPKYYSIGRDTNLKHAVEVGVESIILSHTTPLKVRSKISELLNSKREYRWTVDEDGAVEIGTLEEIDDRCTQFEALSKVLDAQELNCLVRNHLGVKDGDRVGT